MMYWKLAIQNIRRSLRDYIIYFVTLTLTAALMYSFLALGFSSDVLAMAENMSMLTSRITVAEHPHIELHVTVKDVLNPSILNIEIQADVGNLVILR